MSVANNASVVDFTFAVSSNQCSVSSFSVDLVISNIASTYYLYK